MPLDRVHLTSTAADILRLGGADHVSDDQMLLMEIIKRAPGLKPEDLKNCTSTKNSVVPKRSLHKM